MKIPRLIAVLLAQITLVACSGGGVKSPDQASFALSGTLSGLASGESLVLSDGTGSNLTLSNNGSFRFTKQVAFGASYDVTIATQPTGESCTISGSASSTAIQANVTNLVVSCASAQFFVGGTVSGLPTGETLVLNDSVNGDSVTVSSSGSFAFPTELAPGAGYYVVVGTQPSAALCTVTNANGTVGASNVTNVAVSCTPGAATPGYTIGGSLRGLPQGASVVLVDSGNGDVATVTANGTFTFPMKEPSGFSYDVSVQSAPSGETCTVSGSSGYVGLANVTSIAVNCAPAAATYTVGGTVAWGSGASGTFTVSLGGTNSIAVSSPTTSFTLPIALAAGSNYVANITSEPSGSTCYIASGASGYAISADVTDIDVQCAQQVTVYPMTITVSGLPTGDEVYLALNGTVNGTPFGNGTSGWPTDLTGGAQYTMTVSQVYDTNNNAAASTVTCSVSNGTFTVTGSVLEVITCGTASYTIGGTVTGIPASSTTTPYSVTLADNGNDYVTVYGCTQCSNSSPVSYTFPQSVADGASYDVTVATQPSLGSITCVVPNGSGTVSGAKVTNADVSCPPPTWSVGGTVTGLPSGESVGLTDIDTGNVATVTNASSKNYPSFTIDSSLATDLSYDIKVTSQPAGSTCTVSNGMGQVPASTSSGGQTVQTNVTNVLVSCSPNPLYVSGTVTWNNAQTTAAGNVSVTLLLNGQYATSSSVSSVPAATSSGGGTTDGTASSQFSFSQSLTYGSAWAVSEQTVTGGWTCQLTNASGSSITADVTDVQVTCSN